MAEWNVTSSATLAENWRFDAEYWKASYLENLKIVRLSQNGGLEVHLLKKVVRKVTGSAFYPSFVGYYGDDGLPFLRVADLGDLFLKSDNMVKISPSVIRVYRQVSTVRPGDLVVAKGGSIGAVCIVTNEFGEAAVCRDVIAVQTDETLLDPYYLAVFLNTRFGRLQLERNKSQQVQAHLTFPAVERMEVAYPGQDEQNQVRAMAISAYDNATNARRLYAEAQQLLEAELGLDKISFQKPVGYTARFSTVGLSETFFAKRIDSQCFAPDALFYERWLRSHVRCDRLGKLLHSTAKGRQQAESPQWNCDYCSIKHISGRELVGVSKCLLGVDTPVAGTDDLLLAITGATIGKIGIVKRYTRLAFSGDLLMLRAKPEINPNYLLLALDHRVGQVQFFRWITGSTNGHLSPRDAGQVLVPRLDESVEEQIAQLVEKSLSKRLESEQLLDQAKSRVEQLIEEAVKS